MRVYALTSKTWPAPEWAKSWVVVGGQLTTCAPERALALGKLAAKRGHMESGPVTERIRNMRRIAGITELVDMDAGSATAAQIRTRIRAIAAEANDV